jgi:hypothetical protein
MISCVRSAIEKFNITEYEKFTRIFETSRERCATADNLKQHDNQEPTIILPTKSTYGENHPHKQR